MEDPDQDSPKRSQHTLEGTVPITSKQKLSSDNPGQFMEAHTYFKGTKTKYLTGKLIFNV